MGLILTLALGSTVYLGLQFRFTISVIENVLVSVLFYFNLNVLSVLRMMKNMVVSIE